MEDGFYRQWWCSFQGYEAFAYDWINRMLKRFNIIATNTRYVTQDKSNDCNLIWLKFNHAPECQYCFCSKDQ
jgi:hypothetical protein